MTKTVQSSSWALLNNPGRDLTIKKPKKEDNMILLFSALDNLNNLYEKLSRLDYLLKRVKLKLMENEVNDENQN